MRLLIIIGFLSSWAISCGPTETIALNGSADLLTQAEVRAYQGVPDDWSIMRLDAGTSLELVDQAAILHLTVPHYRMELLQAVVANGDSCWVPINDQAVLGPQETLDSLRVEQTARIILTEDADLFRFRAYRRALAGDLDRPLPFLLTEGDRLAARFAEVEGLNRRLLQETEHLVGPVLPGYRLIVREEKVLYVRYWPRWQRMMESGDRPDWQQELVGSLRDNYGQDSLADPQSLIWWLYTGEGERYHRLGDSSTVNSLARLANLVDRERAAFALSLDMAEQAVRPLPAEGLKFWNNQEAILWELDSILATDWSIIPDRERIALGVLRDRLIAPDTSGIRLNYRSGRFD